MITKNDECMQNEDVRRVAGFLAVIFQEASEKDVDICVLTELMFQGLIIAHLGDDFSPDNIYEAILHVQSHLLSLSMEMAARPVKPEKVEASNPLEKGFDLENWNPSTKN